MRIYLDCCCLQRPLDRVTSDRIRDVSEAVMRILDLVDAKSIELVSSDVLSIEISRTPVPV
jgi:hypothetical protein